MNTTTHTPGPWRIRFGHKKRRTVDIVENSRFDLVARCDKKDAYLIFAAPDLLAALTRLLNCPDLNFDAMEPESLEAMEQAREAIARATTTSPGNSGCDKCGTNDREQNSKLCKACNAAGA
jgi:hypothetical protein